MRLSLLNQPEIEALSAALKQSLAALVAQIGTGWRQQHNGDGTHDAVTATSLTVTPGTTSVGKLNLRQVTYIHTAIAGTVNDLTCVGLSTASCLRIVTNQNPLQINGIDATGRQPGDLLLLLNCDTTVAFPADLWLSTENTGSVAANRFAHDVAAPGGGAAPGGPVIVNGTRGVWLCYDYQTTTDAVGARNPRWRIVDPTS